MSADVAAVAGAGLVLLSAAAVHRARTASGGWAALGRLRRAPGRPGAARSSGGLPVPPRWLVAALADAGIDVPAAAVWAAWWGGGAAMVAGASALAGPGLGAVVAAVAVAAPVLAGRVLRGRGTIRYEAAVPAVLDAVARSLRSGASLRQALGEAASGAPGPVAADLAAVAREVEHGAPLTSALEAWAGRRPLVPVRLAVAALCLGAETGGAQARAVDGVAATVRERLALAAEVRALSSQARYSALVIALAPVAFCAFATLTDARTATFLFRTPLGLALLAAGLALDGASALWMARLTRPPA